MLRLGVIELLYDTLAMNASAAFSFLSDMYIVWETSFWKKKTSNDPPCSSIEMKRLIRKVTILNYISKAFNSRYFFVSLVVQNHHFMCFRSFLYRYLNWSMARLKYFLSCFQYCCFVIRKMKKR